MPEDATLTRSGSGSIHVEGRAYLTTVTLASGTATLTFSDVEGIDGTLDTEPYVIAQSPDGAAGITAKGTSQCTIEGTGSDDVECLIVVPE